MTPETKARRRENKYKGREVRRREIELQSIIRTEAISRSHIMSGRRDLTVWGAYEDLKERRQNNEKTKSQS